MRKFVFVIGTSASGKSDLALSLATQYNLPIINVDSIQIYKDLDVGSAKPSREDRLKAIHYLYDYVDVKSKFTVSDYIKDVKNLLEEKKINRAIFCGGSGFYIRALESGLYPEQTVDPESKQKAMALISEQGAEVAWQFLLTKDQTAAKKIHQNDLYRLTRALEIIFSQGKVPTEVLNELEQSSAGIITSSEVKKVGIYWDRETLRQRITLRTQKMLSLGLIDEVKRLQSQGLEGFAPLQSVGYFETLQYLRGEIPLEKLETLIIQSTMQLAKKQMTWFKRDQQIQWIESGKNQDVTQIIKSWLAS